ncbi:MAG: metalloregulator ArsR/SmtB family transcription factor [Gemmatimonadota bacterium]|jgi:DNA-binding transcriptional ArsR family regulator
MVKYRPDIDSVFSAVADPTRRHILERLRTGEHAISDLAEPFDMTLPAVSKHIHVLERAGLVAIRRSGRIRLCSLRTDGLRAAQAWITRFREFWLAELSQVERYLRADERDPKEV